MARTVALVSCVGEKLKVPALAKDLYVSPWFKKASHFAATVADEWFILSAEYGLVRKDDLIAPYEKTLRTMSATERRNWGRRVLDALRAELKKGDAVVLLAGRLYREHIVIPIQEWGCEVEVPMKHLRIGEQLAWLNGQMLDLGVKRRDTLEAG